MQILRLEGKTEDSARLGYRIDDWVTKNPADKSPEAALYHAFNYHFAAVLLKQGAPENIDKAKSLIEETLARIDFDVNPTAVRGDQQVRTLHLMTLALSRLGQHRRAAGIAERILERAEGAGQLSRVAIAANSLVGFWAAEGYRARCAGTPDAARAAYTNALRAVEKGESLRAAQVADASPKTQEATNLLWKSNRFQAEQAVIELELDEHDAARPLLEGLQRDRRGAEELVRASEANGTVTPALMFFRYERLGTAHLLLALAKEAVGIDPEVDAVRARVFLCHRYERHRADRDELANVVVRYAEACRLAGDPKSAIEILEGGLERLQIRCGTTYEPCRFIETQLASLRKASR